VLPLRYTAGETMAVSWRGSTKSARQRSGGPCSDSAAAADSFFAAPLVDSSQQAKRIHDHRRVADGLSGWADRNHEQPAGNNGEPDSRERKEEGFKGRHLRTAGFRLPPKGGLPFATGPKSKENLPTAAVYTIHTRVVCPIGHTEILLCWKVSARLMEDRWRVLSRAAVKNRAQPSKRIQGLRCIRWSTD